MDKLQLVKENSSLINQGNKLLEVLIYPNTLLKTSSTPVKIFDAELLDLIGNMFFTMYTKSGVGLAAVQIGKPLRLFVADCKSDGINEPLVFINPVIIKKTKFKETSEGCLSVPSIYQEVPRAQTVQVKALNILGKSFTLTAKDLLAQCIQHEVEHLNGEIFIEKYKKSNKN